MMLSAVAVTSSADDGPGSFRAAIAAANANSAVSAVIFDRRIDAIDLESTVTYTGAQALKIDGNVATVEPAAGKEGDFDLFVAAGGGDLALSRLTFRRGAQGIVVDVPLAETGLVKVALDRVSIADNDLFGLHVIDLEEVPPPPEDPEADPTQIGSDAGISLSVVASTITGNGTAAHDQDGVRVDERGAGGINVQILNSRLDGNGAEGIELDEGGEGNVELNVLNATFDENGFISSGDPEDPDFDDGIDIDEADEGSALVVLVNVSANGNFDEGIDLNEGGPGDMVLVALGVEASGNTDEGIALEETDEGDMRATLIGVRANGNGASGLQFEEFDAGNLAVDIVHSQVNDNGDFGIYASQAQPGSGSIRLRNVALRRNASGPFNTTIVNEDTGEEEDSGVDFS